MRTLAILLLIFQSENSLPYCGPEDIYNLLEIFFVTL